MEFTVPVFTTNGHYEEVNVNSCPTCFGTVEHTEFCPHCGQLVAKLYDCEIFVCVKGSYCYNCGQALDWSVEEEKE